MHVLRRRHEARVARPARETRQRVEEARRVLSELGTAGHETEVRVDPRRRFVVVARPEVHVTADLVLLAPDDERDLAMGLQADDAVDHVDARLLERLRPLDVLLLVEPRLQLHEHRDLLAVFRRADERGKDRRVRVRPVQGHLDRDRLRVGGRALDHLGDGRERVVRVVEEDVAGADRRKDRGVGLVEDGGYGGREGRILQLAPVEARERHEVASAEGPVHLVDLVLGDLELLLEELSHALGRLRGDLETHDRAESAAPHLLLDRREEVGGLVLLDLDVRVARHAEEVRGNDLEAGEELSEVRLDERLEEEILRLLGLDLLLALEELAEREEARHGLRHLDARELRLARLRVLHLDGEVQGEVREERERMAGVHGERREDGQDVASEVGARGFTLRVVQVGPREDRDPRRRELREEVVHETRDLPPFHFQDGGPHAGEQIGRRQAVVRRLDDLRGELVEEAGDTDHEELVEVRLADREELQALQQRPALVVRLLDHALVEGQPGELPVQERERGRGRVGGKRPRRGRLVLHEAQRAPFSGSQFIAAKHGNPGAVRIPRPGAARARGPSSRYIIDLE